MAYPSYKLDERELFERIRRLELRVNQMDKYDSLAFTRPEDRDANKPEGKPTEVELKPWPNSAKGLKEVIISLSSRFEDQVNQLEFRIARIERELNLVGGTTAQTGETSLLQLSADVRSLKNRVSNLDQDFAELSTKLDDRHQKVVTETENNVSDINCVGSIGVCLMLVAL
ncbi:unnamed protein product [Echinostoma caproni]|uniref:t-SNARE coiled-coil homology domain-containing protein n=1 Tax=Echinostoma caproni TaxID=27848 RepID=A0A183ANA6_9TREM|nr:unnamed protein product [Echinostoma caproni]